MSANDEIAQASSGIHCQEKTEDRQNQIQPAAAIMTANRNDTGDEKHCTENCPDKQQEVLHGGVRGTAARVSGSHDTLRQT
jgi:hypothetical protein